MAMKGHEHLWRHSFHDAFDAVFDRLRAAVDAEHQVALMHAIPIERCRSAERFDVLVLHGCPYDFVRTPRFVGPHVDHDEIVPTLVTRTHATIKLALMSSDVHVNAVLAAMDFVKLCGAPVV